MKNLKTMDWLIEDDLGVKLKVHVQPGGRRSEILGLHGDRIKIRIHAPPVDGKANGEVTRFFAETFGISLSRVEILSGHHSRQKTIVIKGISATDVQNRLGAYLSG